MHTKVFLFSLCLFFFFFFWKGNQLCVFAQLAMHESGFFIISEPFELLEPFRLEHQFCLLCFRLIFGFRFRTGMIFRSFKRLLLLRQQPCFEQHIANWKTGPCSKVLFDWPTVAVIIALCQWDVGTHLGIPGKARSTSSIGKNCLLWPVSVRSFLFKKNGPVS